MKIKNNLPQKFNYNNIYFCKDITKKHMYKCFTYGSGRIIGYVDFEDILDGYTFIPGEKVAFSQRAIKEILSFIEQCNNLS